MVGAIESKELFVGGGIESRHWVFVELSEVAADGWDSILHPGALYCLWSFYQ